MIRKLGSSPSFAGEKNGLRHAAGRYIAAGTTDGRRRVRDLPCGDHRIYLDLEVRRVACRQCGAVKRERLDFLVENALHTSVLPCTWAEVSKRDDQGRRRWSWLDWHTVKGLEKEYMREQLARRL